MKIPNLGYFFLDTIVVYRLGFGCQLLGGVGVPFKIGFKPNAPDLISFSNLLTIASLSSELKLINFYK